MKIETAKSVVDATAALAGSSGIVTVTLAILKTNAVEIGVLISFISLIVYVSFQVLYHRKLTLADENKAYIEKVESKVDDLSDGLTLILDKLNKE